MTKKKVLVIGEDTMKRAGIQQVIMSIVRSLYEEYLFDIVLFHNKKEEYDDEFMSYGGKIFYCPIYDGNNSFLRKVDRYFFKSKLHSFAKKIIQENGPYEVIHCHKAILSGVFLKAAYEDNIPVRIAHAHSVVDLTTDNAIMRRIEAKYLALAKRFSTILLADSYEAGVSQFGNEVNINVVAPAYNDILFNPLVYPRKQKKHELVITQVGQYCENKNQLFTIKVFSEIVKAHPAAHLNFVGFDSIGFLPIINEEIKKFGLVDKVTFYSHDTDIPLLLSESDVFMFPSHTEGFGIAVVEAQAMGVRCYASDTVPQTTDCGGCTYLPLSLGSEQWAETILKDYGQLEGISGRFNCSRFTSKNVANQYLEIYEGKR